MTSAGAAIGGRIGSWVGGWAGEAIDPAGGGIPGAAIGRLAGSALGDAISNAIANNNSTEADGPVVPIDLPDKIPDFNFDEPSQCPVDKNGNKWPWRGKPPQGDDKGAYKNLNGPESLHPDLNHGGILSLTGILMIELVMDIELGGMGRYGRNNDKSDGSANLRFG